MPARDVGRRQGDIGPLVPANDHLRPGQLEFFRSAFALDLFQKGHCCAAANANHRDAGFDGRFRRLVTGSWRGCPGIVQILAMLFTSQQKCNAFEAAPTFNHTPAWVSMAMHGDFLTPDSLTKALVATYRWCIFQQLR